MSTLQSVEEVLVHLEEVLRGPRGNQAGALLTVATTREGAERFLAGRLLFLTKGDNPRRSLSYPQAELLEEWVRPTDIMKRLDGALRGILEVDGRHIPVKFQGAFAEQRMAGRWTVSGWTEASIACTVAAAAGRPPPDPLVQAGLPPHQSLATAVREWVYEELQPLGGDSIPFAGQLIILVPDTRGRIAEAVWDADRLSPIVESAVPAQLELQALFQGSALKRDHHVSVADSAVDFDVPADTRTVTLYLLAGPDCLSVIELTRFRPAFGRRKEELESGVRLKADLAAGENERVEFRRFRLSCG